MAATDLPANGPRWTIDHLQEGVQPGPNGQFTHGTTVTFTTAGGHQGSVFVPDAQLTRDNVGRVVSAKADTIESIAKLTG